jgi:hypothetical protein
MEISDPEVVHVLGTRWQVSSVLVGGKKGAGEGMAIGWPKLE